MGLISMLKEMIVGENPNEGDDNFPWREAPDDAEFVTIACWVCGRQGPHNGREAVIRTAGEGERHEGGVRFAVPFDLLPPRAVEEYFHRRTTEFQQGPALLLMNGRAANELRELVRSGWTGIEGPRPFVPHEPTAEERAYGATFYQMKRDAFRRSGTWADQ